MVVMTLTEFNQKRSQALRMADTEDVLIQRNGVVAYRLSRVRARPRTLAAEIQAGRVRVSQPTRVPFTELPIIECDGDPVQLSLEERERDRWPLGT